MVLLSEPDEERLWLVIAVLFGVSFLLLLASLAQPWYTASFSSGSSVIEGTYHFEDWRYQLCANDDCQDPSPKFGYDRAPEWESLMFWSKNLIGLGVVAIAGFGILLALYYFGYLDQTRWLKVAWVGGFVATLAGISYFTLGAGAAGAEQLVSLVEARGLSGFGTPEPKFWGSQSYANGELASAPAAGWLLAILGLVNLVPPTILLYQFPEREEGPEEEYSVDEEEVALQTRMTDA